MIDPRLVQLVFHPALLSSRGGRRCTIHNTGRQFRIGKTRHPDVFGIGKGATDGACPGGNVGVVDVNWQRTFSLQRR